MLSMQKRIDNTFSNSDKAFVDNLLHKGQPILSNYSQHVCVISNPVRPVTYN